MDDLKPCPFCGKEAKTMNLINDLFIVGCDYNPNCQGHIGKQAPVYYTEELAIRYWNRRDSEQDAVEPMQLQYSKGKEEYWWYESICPSCGCRWITGDNKEQCFCPHCGQKVIDKGIDS